MGLIPRRLFMKKTLLQLTCLFAAIALLFAPITLWATTEEPVPTEEQVTDDESFDDESTDDELIDDESTDDELIDDESTDDELIDDESTDDESTDDESFEDFE